MGGQAVLLVHAQVPLAHHVGGVARLLQELGQQLLVQRDAVGLTRPDDLVLHARVDLPAQEHESKENVRQSHRRKLNRNSFFYEFSDHQAVRSVDFGDMFLIKRLIKILRGE